MEPEGSLPLSQAPPAPILSQLDPVRTPHPTSWRSILILYSHLPLGLPSGLFPSGFPTKNLFTSLLSSIRAARPTNPFSILSSLQYLVRCTDHYARYYVVFSTPTTRRSESKFSFLQLIPVKYFSIYISWTWEIWYIICKNRSHS